MDKEIIFTQSLDTKTLVKAQMLFLFSGKRTYFFLAIYLFILLTVGCSRLIFSENDDLYTEVQESLKPVYIILSIAPVIFLAIYLFLTYSVKTENKKSSRYFNNVTYHLDTENISRSGERFENVHRWEELYRIKETSQWFMICLNKQQSYIIKKSELSAAEMDNLKSLFNSLKPKIKFS